MTRAPTAMYHDDDQIVTDIRNLLEHGYHKESFLREMMQNADDAGASGLHVAFRPDGLGQTAKNPLLNGPLLLIANNGELTVSDEDALYKATGGNKAGDEAKVGRFGLGLKSIFHWCEAFVYCAVTDGEQPRAGVVNPYVRSDGRDPCNSEWQDIKDDLPLLEKSLHSLLRDGLGASTGLLFCAPLRVAEEHLNRGDLRLHDWEWPEPRRSVPSLFDLEAAEVAQGRQRLLLPELVLVLAQCGQLDSVSAEWPGGGFTVARRASPHLARLGRHKLAGEAVDLPDLTRDLRSTIDVSVVGAESWTVEVFGAERTAPHGVELRQDPAWPKDMVARRHEPGKSDKQARKALGHAAVTLVKWPNVAVLPSRVAVRWAAFLPLETAYHVDHQNGLARQHPAPSPLDVVLHGYFFPKPDRKGLEGLTAAGDSIASKWNRSVARDLTLPLVPAVLAAAAPQATRETRDLLMAAARSLAALNVESVEVISTTLLVPIIGAAGTAYRAIDRGEIGRYRRVLGWEEVSGVTWFRRAILDFARAANVELVQEEFVVRDFLPMPLQWQSDEFVGFLAAIQVPDDATADQVFGLLDMLQRTFPRPADLGHGDTVAQAVLGWLQRLQSNGWGPYGRKWPINDFGSRAVKDLLDWLAKGGALAVNVSVGARPAVERLAADAVPGVVLVPCGAQASSGRDSRAVDACAVVLPGLVERIADAEKPQRANRAIGPKAWKLLARDLVRLIGMGRVCSDPTLKGLALIPTWQPARKGEALLSAAMLAANAKAGLVFSAPVGDEDADSPGSVAAALKKPAEDWMKALASALEVSAESLCVVQVDGSDFASIDLDSISRSVCANAVSLHGDFERRKSLFEALCSDHAFNPDRRRAARLLAHGQASQANSDDQLYILPDDGPLRVAATAYLRQRREGWRIVDGAVRRCTTGDDRKALGVSELSESAFLDRLRKEPAGVSPDGFSDEERLALLHIVAASRDKDLFFALPMHAWRSDDRGGSAYSPLADGRTFRSGIDIPAEIATGVTIVADVVDGRVQAAYAEWLREFDVRSLLEVLLMQDASQRHWELILATLRRPTGVLSPLAPAFADLAGDLNQVAWLPTGTHGGVAPVDVVDDLACGSEVRSLLVQFLGDCGARVPALSSVLRVDKTAEVCSLVRNLNGGRSTLVALQQSLENHDIVIPPRWTIGPVDWKPPSFNSNSLQDLESLARHRIGWKLLQSARMDAEAGGNDAAAVDGVAAAFRGALAATDCIATLNALAPSEGRKAEYPADTWFSLLKWIPLETAKQILPKLRLPCRDGVWRMATGLTSSTTGAPSSFIPHDVVREWLRLGTRESAQPPRTGQKLSHSLLSPAGVVAHVERCVRDTVQRRVLGAVFALSGSAEMNGAVQDWLGDIDPKNLRRELQLPENYGSQERVAFFKSASAPSEVVAPGLCGGEVVVKLEHAHHHLLESDPIFEGESTRQPADDAYRFDVRVVLRTCDFGRIDSKARNAVLRETAELFARTIVGSNRAASLPFDRWWRTWGIGSQADIQPARSLLLKELPTKLAELRLDEAPALRPLVDFVAALRHAELDPGGPRGPEERGTRDVVLRTAPDSLAKLLADQRIADALRNQVRKQLDSFAYTAESVLLELIQNADDALEQLATMRGELGVPLAAREVRVGLTDGGPGQSPVLTFTHWGRLINDHGGARYPAGKDHHWHEDLYFMCRILVSPKPGDEGGQHGVQSTGRFGLGFKSVHLISDRPTVHSGTLAFGIQAALLPVEIAENNQEIGEEEVDSLLPTHVRIPLRQDILPADLLKSVFSRLGPIAPVIPAMTRQVFKIDGPAEYGGAHAFEPLPLPGLPDWQVSRSPAKVGTGAFAPTVRLLRFRPSEPHRTIRTVLLGLVDGVPVQLPADVATFWVVAPTEEFWDLGYLVNGDFKLDTGRVRVDFKADKSKKTLDALGQQLGKGLVSLARAIQDSPEVRAIIGCQNEIAGFFTGLWHVLAGGLGSQFELARWASLQRLQAGESGLGLLTRSLAAVPSGMPAPWAQLVGPIGQGDLVCVASNAALAPAVQLLLESIPELRGARVVVANDIAEPLKRIAQVRTEDFTVGKQLRTWSEKLRDEVTPEIAEKLDPLASDDCWDAIEREVDGYPRSDTPLRKWAKSLKFRSADGGMCVVTSLLLPSVAASKAKELSCAKDTLADELLRSAFAPINAVLSDEYAKSPGALDVFLRLRGELSADAAKLAEWAAAADTTAKQRAAAIYLGRGSLRDKVAGSVCAGGQPLPWAVDRATWQRVAKDAGLDDRENQKAEIDLFGPVGSTDRQPAGPAQSAPLSNSEAARRLNNLWENWSNPAYREMRLADQRKKLWPSDWRREQIREWLRGDPGAPKTRRAWIMLFLLAHVLGLGLGGRDGSQHRGFGEFLLHQRARNGRGTWWDLLFGDGAPDGTWIEFFEDWSRSHRWGGGPYDFHMRVIPGMYAATRWWREYATYLTAPLEEVRTAALTPGISPDLAGDYDSADVPAMAGALNRQEWVQEELRYYEVVVVRSIEPTPATGFAPSWELGRILEKLGYFGQGQERNYTSAQVYDWLGSLITPGRADFHGMYATALLIDAKELTKD